MSIMTEEEILNSIIPDPKIEQITLETTSDKKTRVTIKFSISDVVDDDGIGTWFEEANYEKYFLPQLQLAYSYGPVAEDDDEFYDTQNFSITGINKPDTDFIGPDGSRVNKFSFEYTKLLDRDPYYLRARIYSRFDIQQLELEEGIDLFFLNERAGRGQFNRKIKTAVLIDNYEIKYPLQDFRARNFATTFSLDENVIISSFSRSYQDAIDKFEENKRQSKDFLSNLMITRNAQGEAKFLFIFDALSFFKRKSEYRSYFKRMTGAEQSRVLRHADVEELRILRKRVKIVEDSTGGRSVIDFPDDKTIKTIVSLRKPSNDDEFVSYNTDLGAASQVQFSFNQSADPKARGLYFITGTDFDIANRTDGVYSYGVSISIVDNVKHVLRDRIEKFIKMTSEVEELYNILILPENYDSLTNLPKKKITQALGTTVTWSGYTDKLGEMIRMFAPGYQENDKVASFFKLFEEAPETLSPEAIETLADVMRMTSRNALSSIGEAKGLTLGKQKRATINLSISSEKFYTSPRKVFDANIPKMTGLEYLANFSEDITEDVLREVSSLSSETGQVGLKVIDGATFERRLEVEINKFFNTPDSIPTPFLDNDLPVSLTSTGSSYLSPSALFRQRTGPVITTEVSDVQTARNFLNTNIFRTGNLANIARLSGEPEFVLTDGSKEATFLAQHGATFQNSAEAKTVLKNEETKIRTTTRTVSINVDIDTLNTTSITQANESRKDFESFVFSKFAKIMSTPNLGTERTLGNSTNDSALEVDVASPKNIWSSMNLTQRRNNYDSAPNQIKALSLINSSQNTLSKMTNSLINQGEYKVSTDFLVKMQYLTGFMRTTDGLFSVSHPTFKELTLDAYRENQGKNLLCRMKPWVLEEMGVRVTKTGSPIYDSVFIIKPVGDFTTTETIDLSAFEEEASIADHRRFAFENEYELDIEGIKREIDQAVSTINRLTAQNDDLSEEIATLTERIHVLNHEITIINQSRAGSDFDAEYARSGVRKQEASQEIFRLEGSLIPLRERLESNEETIRELQNEVNLKQAELDLATSDKPSNY